MLSDFSYKHDARQCSTLVVTKIHAEDSDDTVLKMLADVVSTAKACMSFSYHVLVGANKYCYHRSWNSPDTYSSPHSFPSCPRRSSSASSFSTSPSFTRKCCRGFPGVSYPSAMSRFFHFTIHIIPREHYPSVVWQ
jgi:hypothetical protein